MVLSNRLKQEIADCDRKAQLELYSLCFGYLLNIVRRYKKNHEDQQTLVNNAFIKIVNNLDKYEEQNNFQGWVKRIVMNEVIDDFRRVKNYKSLLCQESPIENIETIQYAEIDYHYSEQELFTILERLPKATKVVFNLFAIDGYSHKEISEKLGICTETSKWHVKHARRLLKEML